jgi:hypothetical protein
VDTAICAKPGEVLAGQLFYGDSMHRIYFVRPESHGRERDAETCNLSCKKSSTVVPTRGAGLVQIAKSLTDKRERNLDCGSITAKPEVARIWCKGRVGDNSGVK